MEWVWGTVLPTLTPVAEKGGFGSAWAKMLVERTPESAAAAAAAHVPRVAYYAATAAAAAAASITDSSSAASVASAAYAGTSASASAASAALDAFCALGDDDHYWTSIDPCAMLERLLL